MVVAALANEAGLLFSTIQKCSSISIDPSTCRLLLSPILHFSPFALFFNLFYLFFYGDNVEDVLGRFFHTVFFFFLDCNNKYKKAFGHLVFGHQLM